MGWNRLQLFMPWCCCCSTCIGSTCFHSKLNIKGNTKVSPMSREMPLNPRHELVQFTLLFFLAGDVEPTVKTQTDVVQSTLFAALFNNRPTVLWRCWGCLFCYSINDLPLLTPVPPWFSVLVTSPGLRAVMEPSEVALATAIAERQKLRAMSSPTKSSDSVKVISLQERNINISSGESQNILDRHGACLTMPSTRPRNPVMQKHRITEVFQMLNQAQTV